MFQKPWTLAIVFIAGFLCSQCQSSKRSAIKSVSKKTLVGSGCKSWNKTYKNTGEGLSKIFDKDKSIDQRACTLAIENSIESIIRKKDYIETNSSCAGELNCAVSTADGSKWGILEDAMSFQPFGDNTVSKEKASTSCILGKKRVGTSALYMRTAKTIGLISCVCKCLN